MNSASEPVITVTHGYVSKKQNSGYFFFFFTEYLVVKRNLKLSMNFMETHLYENRVKNELLE